jgi:NNP family nitrate/nitrite transporter-like MFS transporter
MERSINLLNLLSPTYVFFITFVAWTAYSPLGSVFLKVYHLNLVQLGLLLALPKLMALPTRYIAGLLSDTIGAKKTLLLIPILSAIALVLTSFANTITQLYISAGLLGVAGSTFPAGIAYVNRKFEFFKGTYLGIYGGLGNFGSAVSGIIVPLLYVNFGFRSTFIILSILILSSIIPVLFSSEDIIEKKVTKLSPLVVEFFMVTLVFLLLVSLIKLSTLYLISSEVILTAILVSLIKIHGDNKTFYMSYIYFVTFGGFLAVGLWVPSIFYLVYHLKLLSSGLVLFGYGLTTIFFRPLGGTIGDFLGSNKAIYISLLSIMISTLTFSWSLYNKELLISLISVISLGASLSLANGAVFKKVSESFGSDKIGNASGIIGGFAGFGGFVITAGLSYIDLINVALSPLLLLFLALIALLILFIKI